MFCGAQRPRASRSGGIGRFKVLARRLEGATELRALDLRGGTQGQHYPFLLDSAKCGLADENNRSWRVKSTRLTRHQLKVNGEKIEPDKFQVETENKIFTTVKRGLRNNFQNKIIMVFLGGPPV